MNFVWTKRVPAESLNGTFALDGALHAALVATGTKDGPIPKGLRADELAVYTIVSRVLLNLDESITKE